MSIFIVVSSSTRAVKACQVVLRMVDTSSKDKIWENPIWLYSNMIFDTNHQFSKFSRYKTVKEDDKESQFYITGIKICLYLDSCGLLHIEIILVAEFPDMILGGLLGQFFHDSFAEVGSEFVIMSKSFLENVQSWFRMLDPTLFFRRVCKSWFVHTVGLQS